MGIIDRLMRAVQTVGTVVDSARHVASDAAAIESNLTSGAEPRTVRTGQAINQVQGLVEEHIHPYVSGALDKVTAAAGKVQGPVGLAHSGASFANKATLGTVPPLHVAHALTGLANTGLTAVQVGAQVARDTHEITTALHEQGARDAVQTGNFATAARNAAEAAKSKFTKRNVKKWVTADMAEERQRRAGAASSTADDYTATSIAERAEAAVNTVQDATASHSRGGMASKLVGGLLPIPNAAKWAHRAADTVDSAGNILDSTAEKIDNSPINQRIRDRMDPQNRADQGRDR